MSSIAFSLLGPLRVTTADGTKIEVRDTARQTLLAAVLLEAGTFVSLDRLIGRFWAEERGGPSDSRGHNADSPS